MGKKGRLKGSLNYSIQYLKPTLIIGSHSCRKNLPIKNVGFPKGRLLGQIIQEVTRLTDEKLTNKSSPRIHSTTPSHLPQPVKIDSNKKLLPTLDYSINVLYRISILGGKLSQNE